MKFLLDTHVFLWLADISTMPSHIRALLEEEENTLYLSSISVWEIEQKFQQGKLKLPVEPKIIVAEFYKSYGIEPQPFNEESAFMLNKLPLLHRDPFDRMLICQAIHYNMTLITADKRIQQYPVKTIW